MSEWKLNASRIKFLVLGHRYQVLLLKDLAQLEVRDRLGYKLLHTRLPRFLLENFLGEGSEAYDKRQLELLASFLAVGFVELLDLDRSLGTVQLGHAVVKQNQGVECTAVILSSQIDL